MCVLILRQIHTHIRHGQSATLLPRTGVHSIDFHSQLPEKYTTQAARQALHNIYHVSVIILSAQPFCTKTYSFIYNCNNQYFTGTENGHSNTTVYMHSKSIQTLEINEQFYTKSKLPILALWSFWWSTNSYVLPFYILWGMREHIDLRTTVLMGPENDCGFSRLAINHTTCSLQL